MKRTKKILSILLTLVMALAMSIPAFATGSEGATPSETKGTITIDNAVVGQTYSAYRLFDLESYNATSGAYAYKANSAWKTWLGTQTTYVSFDTQGYVTWVKGADAAAFAKAAQAYAKEHKDSISAVQTKIATSTTEGATTATVEFKNLELGYYLVSTSLGTICSLDTTNPNVTIKEKNEVPTIDKLVKEDSTGVYGEKNTAQIGDTVEFKTTVHAKKGAQNYIVHDTMSIGLTLNKNSIKIYSGEIKDDKEVSTSSYKVRYGLQHNVVGELLGGYTCDFEIVFNQEYLDSITEDIDIFITYTATLNDKAFIYDKANTNKTKLNYGDNSYNSTEWAETETYTYMFDVIKTDSNKKLLNGAKFELYDDKEKGNKIALVKESEGVYRVATGDEIQAEGFTSAVIEAGKVTVKGLDSDTYWLEEIEAPAGYNKLASRVEVKIENANLSTSMTGDTWAEGDGGVHITNISGTELPSTGGIGTTVFYAAGVILALGAAVALVARRRMRTE